MQRRARGAGQLDGQVFFLHFIAAVGIANNRLYYAWDGHGHPERGARTDELTSGAAPRDELARITDRESAARNHADRLFTGW